VLRIHNLTNMGDGNRRHWGKAANKVFHRRRSMDEPQNTFGYTLNSKGIPENFEPATTLGTCAGEMFVDRVFVKERTEKGFISESELYRGFEAAERHFTDNPREDEYTYDSMNFHCYEHIPYLIYCLPFGVVYYKELDHE
jgi:hypothetical protein